MCIPSTVMTGISVLGSVLGMAHSISSQNAQARAAAENQARANAQAQQNARIAEQNARQALADGEKEKEKIRLEQQALQGKKAVEYGAGNIALSSGSPLTILGEMASQEENLMQEAGEKARRQAQNYKEQANSSYRHIQNTQSNTSLATANSIFSGLESIGNSFNDYAESKSETQTALTVKGKRGANYF